MALFFGNMKDALVAFSLSTLVVAGFSSMPAAALQAQDVKPTKDDNRIELIEEKAPRVSKNTAKISLLKVESPKLGKGIQARNDYLSLGKPDRSGFNLNFNVKNLDALAMERMLKLSGITAGTTRTNSLLSREGGVDLTIVSDTAIGSFFDGLSLSVVSGLEYSTSDAGFDTFGLSPEDSALALKYKDILPERRYNVGFALGYAGVEIDANYQEKEAGVSDGYKALNVGLAYRSTNWMTRLAASEYTYNMNPNVSPVPANTRHLYQFELGGAVRMSSRMSLTAGFKLTDYGSLLYNDGSTWGQSFYLGGRFSY